MTNDSFVYGLGEHARPLLLDSRTYTLWAGGISRVQKVINQKNR